MNEALASALVLVSAELTNPAPDARGQVRGNPNYRYLSLPALIDHIRPVLTKNGLTFYQWVDRDGALMCIVTTLVHVSGEAVDCHGPWGSIPASWQDIGSANTYARRYSLSTAVGIAADEDDDGAKAQRATVAGGSTANANRGQGSVTSTPDVNGAQAVSTSAVPPQGAPDAAPPSHSATDHAEARTGTDEPAAGDATATRGEDVPTPAAGSHNYLNKDDQGLLKSQYGGQVNAIKAYKARFGSHITRLADITYEMRDELEGANA